MAINRFDQLIEHWDAVLRKAFLDAVYAMRDHAQLDQIERMIRAGDIEGAIRAVGLDPTAFRQYLQKYSAAYEAAGTATAVAMPTTVAADGMRLVVRFNVRNPGAEEYLSRYSSTFIQDVFDDQRQMIRDVLRRGMEQGLNPRTVALDLVGRVGISGSRQGGLIGLTAKQAEWVQDYALDLIVNPARSLTRSLRDKRFDAVVRRAVDQGMRIPAETQQKMVVAYKNRALRYRAETIARTEAISALHNAQEEAVQQSFAGGVVTPDNLSFVWRTAKDSRVRDSHHAMEGQTKPYGQMFVTGDGNMLRFPGDDIAPPSETINCRCYRQLKVDFFQGLR